MSLVDAFAIVALFLHAPLCSGDVSERRQLLARHASYSVFTAHVIAREKRKDLQVLMVPI